MPGIFQRNRAQVNDTPSVDAAAWMMCRGRKYSLFRGPSSGAHLPAAKRVREQLSGLKTVVTVFCDEGEKYLHEYFMQPGGGKVDAKYFR